jgi:hypothetical protein
MGDFVHTGTLHHTACTIMVAHRFAVGEEIVGPSGDRYKVVAVRYAGRIAGGAYLCKAVVDGKAACNPRPMHISATDRHFAPAP